MSEMPKANSFGPSSGVAPPSASLGAELRRERERRAISIASIAESTKILPALLEGLENNDVSRWPSGFYRRAFIRAYATAIGLDPEPVVRQFLTRFPDPEDEGGAVAAPARMATHQKPAAAPTPSLRLTLEGPRRTSFSSGAVFEGWRRLLAASFDALALAVGGTAFYLTMGVVWQPLSLLAGGYFLGSILVLGTTPGLRLFGSSPRSSRLNQL
ncbi:MAG: helix-turn-helix domain-containing protein [Acidobacteriota bacterium]